MFFFSESLLHEPPSSDLLTTGGGTEDRRFSSHKRYIEYTFQIVVESKLSWLPGTLCQKVTFRGYGVRSEYIFGSQLSFDSTTIFIDIVTENRMFSA